MSQFIKKAHVETEYTPQDIQELKRCAADPVYFIRNYCYIQNQKLGRVKFDLRPYQVRIIESLHKNRFNILMIGRQCGKTETTAAYALWFSCFNPDKNVLVASNKQKGATDIMNRIKYMYESLPDFIRPGVVFYNRGSVEFDNGSKIWSEATTPDTGRGKSVGLFICDELAHVKRNIQEAMWSSILPTLSTGGSCVVMSTPNGDSDLFAQLWRQANSGVVLEGEDPFMPIYVDISEVPGRDETWQRMMRTKLGDILFNQEYLCHFLSSDPLLINSIRLLSLQPKAPMFIDKGFSFWKEPQHNRSYLIGVDVAEGVKQDFSTIEVFEMESMEQVAEYRNNVVKEDQLYNAIKWIIQKILSYRNPQTGKPPEIHWSFENNSVGAVIGALYYNDEKFPETPIIVSGKGDKLGFRTTNSAKIEACRNLKNVVEKQKGGLIINSAHLIFELKNYIQTGASYAAKFGATDDLISACLIITRIIKYLSEYEPEAFDKLYRSEGEFYEKTTNEFDEPMPFVF